MRVERNPPDLRALVPGPESVAGEVAEIVRRVREGGDAVLREYVERLDKGIEGADVHAEDVAGLDRAEVPDSLHAGLEAAIANVRAVARAGLSDDRIVELPQGHTVLVYDVPLRRAAVYVPSGRNPYPSTVVMGVVTAKVAGVEEVVVCSPGSHPAVLAAAEMCGADEVHAMGGAHAIAALAYGTESIERVDVIVGPGGLHVQEAKRQVSGDVGIDMFAGPSDLMIVADTDADPDLIAADLLAQAEHGAGTVVVLVSERALLDAVEARMAGVESDAVLALVEGGGLAVVEAFAPEHLQLVGPRAEALASQVRSVGCVLVGPASGTAFADYVAGSNHTLPTGGAARFASGLNIRHFRRRMTEVRIPAAAAAQLAPAGAAIAEAEGFTAHAASMRLRERPTQ